MDKHTDILYRLARFLAGVPPDTLGAMVLFALENPGIMATLFAVVLFVSKYVVGLIVSTFLAWYGGKMLAIHVWPRLPSRLRQLLRRVEGRILLQPPDQDRAGARGDRSAFSRNSKRHPHW